MRRLLILCGAVLAAACNSNVAQSAVGEFASPTGIAATGARDRDLIFMANTGRDGIRAVQLCNHAILPDGGVDPADTCSASENGQFITAPIRVFAASVETGERPMRLAGARLKRSDGSAAGVLLAAGVAQQVSNGGTTDAGVTDGGVTADGGATVAVVDARSLLDSQNTRIAPKPVQYLPVGSTAVDVVTVNPFDPDLDLEATADPGTTVPAFIATQTELLLVDVGLDASEWAALPQIRGRCTLDPIVPTRIAVAPGDPSRVYVADGAGGGVFSVLASNLSAGGAACNGQNIASLDGRSVRSIALSPPWYEQRSDGPVTHPAGELLLMVVDPLPAVVAGNPLDPGGLIFAGTGTGQVPKGIVPNPAYPLVPGTGTAPLSPPEAMQPLALSGKGLMQEGAFLRAVPPRPAPIVPDLAVCTAAPCTPIFVGLPSGSPTHLFNLVAAVTATDGITYFIDVPNRRFINQNRYSDLGEATTFPTLGAVTQTSAGPELEINTAAFEPGLVHTLAWRAIWHSPIPGLDRRGGTVTSLGNGTLRFTPSLANLDIWMKPNDPIIALRVKDVVAFTGFQSAGDNSAGCQEVFKETPNRFELTITDVAADHLDLAELLPGPTVPGFQPNCSKFGAVVEVRTAADQPWLLIAGDTLKGRTAKDQTFPVHERRFDYPRSAYSSDPNTAPFPSLANDVSYTLKFKTADPTAPGFIFSWSVDSGLLTAGYRDVGTVALNAGYATAVYSYSSLRSANLLFTSVTGVNEVIQVNPAATSTTLVFYR